MTKFGAAQGLKRVEDHRLITGHGRYTDDIVLPRQAVGYALRSPYAAARLVGIDVAAARAMPGVLAIYTAAEIDKAGIGKLGSVVPIKNRDGSMRSDPQRPVLAKDHVRFVGEVVAFVVAETLAAARDAAEAIQVDYDDQPAVGTMAAATAAGAPQIWPDAPGNRCFDWGTGNAKLADELFSNAARVVSLEVVNNRIIVASMEGRACNADYDAATGRWTFYVGSQGVFGMRGGLARPLNVDADRIRVVTPDVGGGFGMKIFMYPEYVLCAHAAHELGRPVKWTGDRSESFLSDTGGRGNFSRAELALDADGKALAVRVHTQAELGAYLSDFAPFIPTMAGSRVLPSVYQFKAVSVRVEGIFTNTTPIDAFRGAGRPEANYLTERLMDQAARELGRDPIEFRRANMVQPDQMPWTSALGAVYDSGDFPAVAHEAAELADWQGFAARRAEAAKRGMKRGIGVAYYLEATGGAPMERAEVRFGADDHVELLVGTQSTGQGHETAYVQLLHDKLGIPLDRIRVVQGDSDKIASGGGTGGARSLYSEGGAILAVADKVIEKGRDAAAEALEAASSDIVFERGAFRIAGTDRALGVLDLARQLREKGGEAAARAALDAFAVWDIKAHTFPNGCHICELEVDPETGTITVDRYTVVDDMGTVLNPMICQGQIHGGVVHGLGQALLEHVAYDDGGQLLSGSFMDYGVPRADDVPAINVVFHPVPCKSNPLGVKGAGEAGTVGATPASMNALLDALWDLGVRKVDMPATPEVVWRTIQAARG